MLCVEYEQKFYLLLARVQPTAHDFVMLSLASCGKLLNTQACVRVFVNVSTCVFVCVLKALRQNKTPLNRYTPFVSLSQERYYPGLPLF